MKQNSFQSDRFMLFFLIWERLRQVNFTQTTEKTAQTAFEPGKKKRKFLMLENVKENERKQTQGEIAKVIEALYDLLTSCLVDRTNAFHL